MIIQELSGQLSLEGVDPLQSERFTVRKRDGRTVDFDETRIALALESAFRAEKGITCDEALDDETEGRIQKLTETIVRRCFSQALRGEDLEVERIQDILETQLMIEGYHSIARRCIVYREERRKARALRGLRDLEGRLQAKLYVSHRDGSRELFDPQRVARQLVNACRGLEDSCSTHDLTQETLQKLYDGIRTDEIDNAMICAAKARIDRDPAYSWVARRLLLKKVHREVLLEGEPAGDIGAQHRQRFPAYLEKGVEGRRLHPQLLGFDLGRIAAALRLERDEVLSFGGLQMLFDRYLLRQGERLWETPQYFWMRVAMGLALNERGDREARAVEFYEILSTLRFIPSTATLLNAGTLRPQLSSGFLSTVSDDLEHIFKVISDDAKVSRWAGGVGNDWTNIRATGSLIQSTNGESQGVIPFLKVANDTLAAVHQGSRRSGAMSAYLEIWHLDIGDFLELRNSAGDSRRRTPDLHTANWIPDLFMKRVCEQGSWTLFSPCDVPDLHELYGAAFEKRYVEYEQMADRGEIKRFMRVEAIQLWRKMLTSLFETGHPWITFKDPPNVRSMQNHTGVIHGSSPGAETFLNSSAEETAACPLGSVNLAAHWSERGLDETLLSQTIATAMRMLDNAIDVGFYPTPEAQFAALKHRAVGLGLMGFQDVLFKLRIPYASAAAVEFADQTMEMISFHAILASTGLAQDRGVYPSYRGSRWDQGLLPIDTIDSVEKERGGFLAMDRGATRDWSGVRAAIKKDGMRNSHCLAIAPTTSISQIAGVIPSIEPNPEPAFTSTHSFRDSIPLNVHLIEELKALNLWNEEMADELKYFHGSVQAIEWIPADLKEIYRTAYEIEPRWLIECASRRQKWIDMGQSLTLYLAEPNGKRLHEMYFLAWEKGLKGTHHLQTWAVPSRGKPAEFFRRRLLEPRRLKADSKPDSTSENRDPERIDPEPAKDLTHASVAECRP